MTGTHVLKRIQAQPASDGAGVKITRVSPTGHTLFIDPFLMLDEIKSDEASDYMAGFPPHPHRGFETITYLRQGKLDHEDHMGNKGSVDSGGAQWMTAGKGVIHSEMPQQQDHGFHGFQLWLNLPASEKMRTPEYRDIGAAEIPHLNINSHHVVILAGQLTNKDNPVQGPIGDRATTPYLLDIEFGDHTALTLNLPKDLNLLLYPYEGDVQVGSETLRQNTMGQIYNDGSIVLQANKNHKALLLGGTPLQEPVVQHGPFVMNSREQIEQAIFDYQRGELA